MTANGFASKGLSDGDTIETSGSAAKSQRNPNQRLPSTPSFASIVAEASGVANMLDQEKRYIFGLTQAVSQIEDSFEKLHSRFTDIENRVASFESMSGRLSYRLETALHAMQERTAGDPQLARNQTSLQTAVESAERKLAEHSDTIRFLSEENRTLRETITGVERDNRLVVDEVARMRNEVALLDRQDDTAPAPEAPTEVEDPQSSPLESAEAVAASSEPASQPPQNTVVADSKPGASDDDIDQLIAEISRSIDYHKSELMRMQGQAEALLGRIASADSAPPRLAIDRIDTNNQDVAAAASRAASERKLVEIKVLSSSYEALVRDLEKSRAALMGHSPAAQHEPPDTGQDASQHLAEAARREAPQDQLQSRPQDAMQAAAPDDPLPEEPKSLQEPERLRECEPEPVPAQAAEPPAPLPPQALSAGNEISKINSLRAMYEKRTEELKAELMLERRERQFAESSLQVSRAERLQLQRELAKFRAMGWRKISPDGASDPTPSHDPEAVRRRISAA